MILPSLAELPLVVVAAAADVVPAALSLDVVLELADLLLLLHAVTRAVLARAALASAVHLTAVFIGFLSGGADEC